MVKTNPGKLGKKVKELRDARGWSQPELELKSGVSRSNIAAGEIARLG